MPHTLSGFCHATVLQIGEYLIGKLQGVFCCFPQVISTLKSAVPSKMFVFVLFFVITELDFFCIFFTAERSCTGLIEFESKSDGIEGLTMVNHTPITSPGISKLKICYNSMSLFCLYFSPLITLLFLNGTISSHLLYYFFQIIFKMSVF